MLFSWFDMRWPPFHSTLPIPHRYRQSTPLPHLKFASPRDYPAHPLTLHPWLLQAHPPSPGSPTLRPFLLHSDPTQIRVSSLPPTHLSNLIALSGSMWTLPLLSCRADVTAIMARYQTRQTRALRPKLWSLGSDSGNIYAGRVLATASANRIAALDALTAHFRRQLSSGFCRKRQSHPPNRSTSPSRIDHQIPLLKNSLLSGVSIAYFLQCHGRQKKII